MQHSACKLQHTLCSIRSETRKAFVQNRGRCHELLQPFQSQTAQDIYLLSVGTSSLTHTHTHHLQGRVHVKPPFPSLASFSGISFRAPLIWWLLTWRCKTTVKNKEFPPNVALYILNPNMKKQSFAGKVLRRVGMPRPSAAKMPAGDTFPAVGPMGSDAMLRNPL